jgi:predicted transcriptional regulator
MEGSAALISIHPNYVEKILSGDKRLEFRRSWAASPVRFIVIYATAPVQRIVAITELGKVTRGTKTQLWELGRSSGGGISRRKLYAYMEGKKQGVALELLHTRKFAEEIQPQTLFGDAFRPPQSFRYLNRSELILLSRQLGAPIWE